LKLIVKFNDDKRKIIVMTSIKNGDVVKIEYEALSSDGTFIDSSEMQGKLLKAKIGSGDLIAGFEKALIGMEEGEEKEITIKPIEAYGFPVPELIHIVKKPEKKICLNQDVEIALKFRSNEELRAKVLKETKDKLILDFNHPLAGKTLKLKFKVIKVSN
jgi:FKBP-type peptidyl-prolyl cis-trans isomerase 2